MKPHGEEEEEEDKHVKDWKSGQNKGKRGMLTNH